MEEPQIVKSRKVYATFYKQIFAKYLYGANFGTFKFSECEHKMTKESLMNNKKKGKIVI